MRRQKPENAEGVVWSFSPVLSVTWDEEHGFVATIDFDGSFNHALDEHGDAIADEEDEWGSFALEEWVRENCSDPATPASIVLFSRYKPNNPDYRTAEDFQKEFLELLNKTSVADEANRRPE